MTRPTDRAEQRRATVRAQLEAEPDTIANRVRKARARRNAALQMHEAGMSWPEVGAHFGVTAARASQLAARATRAGNPVAREPVSAWKGTIDEWLQMRLRRIDETLATTKARRLAREAT